MRFAVASAVPVAILLAIVSLGGLLSPAYAHELPAWQAQAIGQDWFDLLVAAPVLALCGILARTYRWRVLLAGAYAYTVYELAIYAFAIHFNSLFLVYCATFGLAGYALVALVVTLSREVERVDRGAARLAGSFLVAVGVLFGLLWLSEDVPAMLRGAAPQSLVDTGLLTNPVHVIDLAFVLPAHVIAGIWIWRQRRLGELLAPIVLAFGVLMAASIGGMLVVMGETIGVAVAMFVVASFAAAVLFRLLRSAASPQALASHQPS